MNVYLEVIIEHRQGKFATTEEVADEAISLLDGQTLSVGDSEYEITEVNSIEAPSKKVKK